MKAVAFALEKQRLLIDSAARREALARHCAELAPLWQTADRVDAGLRWARRHPEAIVGGVAVAAALRPGVRRFLWRWGRRAFLVWRLWRKTVGNAASPVR